MGLVPLQLHEQPLLRVVHSFRACGITQTFTVRAVHSRRISSAGKTRTYRLHHSPTCSADAVRLPAVVASAGLFPVYFRINASANLERHGAPHATFYVPVLHTLTRAAHLFVVLHWILYTGSCTSWLRAYRTPFTHYATTTTFPRTAWHTGYYRHALTTTLRVLRTAAGCLLALPV